MTIGGSSVNSLTLGFKILSLISKSKTGELGVTEISKTLGISKSTVHRHLSTMEYINVVEKISETRKYRLGWTLFLLGKEVTLEKTLVSVARPYLERLQLKIGESVNLGIKKGCHVAIIDIVNSQDVLGARLKIGIKEPIHATALGKIFLANLSDDAFEEYFSDFGHTLVKFTEHTKTKMDEFREELICIRQKGVAYDNEELKEGLKCVATGINDAEQLIAAVSISGPAFRFNDHILSHTATELKKTTEEISQLLKF